MTEGSRDLDQFVHAATFIYYNDLEKEQKDLEEEERKDRWQNTLITVLLEVPLGPNPTCRRVFNVDTPL
jgi:hypothetical protein